MAFFLIGIALLVEAVFASPARATDFFVYPVKASLTLQMVVVDFSMDFDSIAETKLNEQDVVNLALGNPLGTKVDKNTRILAIATPFEGTSSSPKSKLIVFDPTASGPAKIKATVARATSLELEAAAVQGGVQGQGIANADIQAVGDSGEHLNATSVLLTGSGKTTPGVPPGPDGKISWKGQVAGRISFTTTENAQENTFSGFFVSGKVSASGKSIGQFSE